MDSYTSLLERTRVPQPSLQRFAVISIFEKIRSAPPHLNADSDAGRDAITKCLYSASSPVVDQSVRELCRLVKDSKFDLSLGLLELQSALEGCDSKFVNVFVKGLGFLVRYGFQKDHSSFRFSSSHTHPFIKVLSCRSEVQTELVKQVLLFISQDKQFGMGEVCEFLRPLLNFSVIKIPLSASLGMFVEDLIRSMASFCCSFPMEALPVIKLLMGCLKHLPVKNADSSRQMELEKVFCLLEDIVSAYVVVLRHLVGMGLLVQEAQLCGVELLQTVFSLSTDFDKHCGWVDFIVDVSMRFICVQRELGLSFIPELSSVIPSLFVTLIQLELEHEQFSVVKLLIILFKWKSENDSVTSREELLFIFPVINLVSSPCKSVKQAAIDLLSMLEKILTNSLAVPKTNLTMQGRYPTISRREDIILRLLQQLWSEDQPSLFSSCVLNLAPNDGTNFDDMHAMPKAWTSLLKDYSTSIIGRRKSLLPVSQSQIFVLEMSMLLCAIASVLVMHNKLGDSAVDLLAVVGNMDPKLSVPLLLTVLFYNKIFRREHKDIDSPSMLLKLLEMLPSLASHPVMVPLVIQTILPMLQKDVKPLLYATALRLLCRTWETNDRVFGTLQGVLHPQCFTQFMSEKNSCISMAASIRDVCRKNPDRGVDLILSVSACIESQDSTVQGLGFQSLSHLCEADVIDFYTAWDVISKHVLESLRNPHAASSACLLLKWGALDAEAYPEAGKQVMQILWDIGTSRHSGHDGSMWAKARVSAFDALSQYEVSHFEKCLPNFKKRNLELLTSETDPEILHTVEEFEAKIITYEHITRRRAVKEKRIAASKIEKLLDVFPRNIFASGNVFGAKQLPGAALFCFPLAPKSLTKGPQNAQGLQDVHAIYENVLVEIVSSLQLSRNIVIALLSLQSLKSFMQRWMRACITFLDAKAPSTALEKTSKAADGILKIIRRLAEESIPRSAENIALAFGALCEVLPPSSHAVKSAASKFLLDWLFLYEHEHRQWSAAISLGVISSCLHVTDHKQKFQNIEALIEVASCSRSILVKGACGLGLGLSCQGLLTSVEAARDSNLERGSCNTQEIDLVGKIVRILSQMICQFSPSSTDLSESISMYFPLGTDITDSLSTYESLDKDYDDLEDDVWGVAGLVLGLGSSVGAVYRAGAHDVVNKIKSSVISWIPHLNTEIQNSSNNGDLDILLSVGSCLAIPMIVSFCQRVELMHDYELDHLLTGLKELISEILSIKKSGAFHQSLLMASCVGAGSLLSCILNEGVHSLEVELVKDFLVLFKRSYSDPHPPLVHFGGMLGVVNALGAGAGSLVQSYRLTTSRSTYDRKDSVFIIGPLLSCPSLEPQLTSLVQDMFLVAQHSDDPILKQYAAWAVSTLRQYLWFKEFQTVDNSSPSDAAGKESQNLPQDGVVLELSLWLMQLNHPEEGALSHVYTIATTLRCLCRAPRLPGLDWGGIIRRCMKYESQVAKLSPQLVTDKGILREECLKLCLAHANQFDSLLNFLDELSDLSRFSTLELNLQSWILLHLSDLSKNFSGSRIEKLFVDVANFLSSLHSNRTCNTEQKSLLRVACWQGLHLCMDETSSDASEYVSNMECCMEVLFSSLPSLHSAVVREMEQGHSVEWLAAIKCLAKARQSWLLKFLQVPEGNLVVGSGDFSEVVKKVQARARLVQCGSFPVSELARLKAYLLNIKLDGIWDALVEIVAALQHLDTNTKKQWLVETVEISCVTTHPSTALQFLGLLCGSFSKYMPLLVMDKKTVLSDLPVTLSSLLSDTRWASVAETVVSNLWSSTQRIYDWSSRVSSGNNSSIQQPIDPSENEAAGFLLKVLHHSCLLLREYLSPEQQLMLANVVLP